MKQAIVTGGSGFIGSWLISELLQNDYTVTAIVRDKKRLIPKIRRACTCIEKEISELTVADFNSENPFDAFFHLAWCGVSADHKNDVTLQIQNVIMAINALQICNKLSCKKFISAGTVAEYALSKDVIDVNTKQTPNDMYGAAKAATYFFVSVLARQLAQPFIWMIIPSTFGERRNDNNILTYTIKSLLSCSKPDYGDLEQMWDFLYVGEVVRAMRLIAEKGIPGKVYGIGSGTYRTLREYIEKTRDIINPKLPLGIGNKPSLSDKSFSSCVNIYDLIKDTGFVPTVSFEKGMEKTVKYYEMLMKREGS